MQSQQDFLELRITNHPMNQPDLQEYVRYRKALEQKTPLPPKALQRLRKRECSTKKDFLYFYFEESQYIYHKKTRPEKSSQQLPRQNASIDQNLKNSDTNKNNSREN